MDTSGKHPPNRERDVMFLSKVADPERCHPLFRAKTQKSIKKNSFSHSKTIAGICFKSFVGSFA
jgi:hypothetical protein